MKIKVLVYKKHPNTPQIRDAIRILNGVQNYFHFILSDNEENDICATSFVDWIAICKKQPAMIEEPQIYITAKRFVDNWFSHQGYNFSVISTNDWNESFAPPSLRIYISYQIAQAAVSFIAEFDDEMEMHMVHDRAEGCIFDMCVNKSDIKLGMVAGTICPQCRSVLVRFGMQEHAINAVERILKFIRAEAIGRPQVFDDNAAFIVMPYTNNDENDHAYTYGIQAALQELNIRCVRADDRIVSGQLLENIRGFIERNRFVIAKVDADNLNVYFELGLAMGLEKDVLLICEQEHILQLPSDLKNWHCLTYRYGDYSGLKKAIIKFYEDNYYYPRQQIATKAT